MANGQSANALDLDAATDQLYAISPDDFVERRKALAAQARQAGDRELAKQITQLRRPTRSAWLVNMVAREAGDDVTALLDLGAELADAQQRGSGPDLRRLSQQRRVAVDALAGRAVRIGRDLGYAAPDGARQEVAQTLQAALGEPEVAELVRRGRLTQATTYGGFGPSDLTAALAASMPDAAARLAAPHATAEAEADSSTEDAAAEEAAAEPEESAADRQRREQAEDAAREARAAADHAQAELQQAEADSESATARADELADEVDTLRTRLRETETAEREAREQARAARKRHIELRQAAVAAEKAAADAEQVAGAEHVAGAAGAQL